jgi:octaprenyl-diphosphate synthase
MQFEHLIADVKPDLALVEQTILSHLGTEIPLLNDVAKHILNSGGKRLRPAVLILSARMFGGGGGQVHHAAAALEFLHTATLLHDDVVDVSDTRRRQRTARVVWGNAASVLVGDYLLAIAFRSLTLLKNLTVLDTISDTTSLMAKGEILQLIRRYDTATESDYLAIIIHKTASLFAAAAKIGACFGGAGEQEQQQLYQYGHELGIAFQIVDDALDYVEERDKIGKPLGADFKERKVTLPLSRLLAVLQDREREDLMARLAKDTIDDGDVHHVVGLMRREDILPYTLGEARKYVERAKSRLEALPGLPENQRLSQLADFVVNREF